MSDSLSPHCILTELGVTNSRATHPRKGREGKGVGREGSCRSLIHTSLGTRERARMDASLRSEIRGVR